MRNNFIQELFHGNIAPQSQTISSDKQFKAAWDKMVDVEEKLSHRLDGEEKKLFDEYVNSYGLVLSMSDAESFIRGFKIGARIIYDTFNDVEELMFV